MIQHGGSRRTRVKVITDPVKYQQHRRKKVLRQLRQAGAAILVLLAICAVFWLAFQLVGRPHALPQ
jgi:hypothetical protein